MMICHDFHENNQLYFSPAHEYGVYTDSSVTVSTLRTLLSVKFILARRLQVITSCSRMHSLAMS
jgi:hypothetical protein